MTTFRKSVPSPARAGAGAPSPKKGLVTLIHSDDVLTFPARDANGVKMVGNIVLKAGAKMLTLYMTGSTQKSTYGVEGDEDMEGFIPKFEGIHPGDEIEINEFVQNALGEGFIVIYGLGCGTNQGKVLGDPCNPLKLKPEFSDDKDGTKTTLVFEAPIKSRQIPGFYFGTTSYAVYPETADSDVDFLVATGNVYQLPEIGVTAVITAASIDIAHGEIVTIIGGGGAGPFTLDKGIGGDVTFILKDGTQWVALEDATISFKVFTEGATTYLVEEARTA